MTSIPLFATCARGHTKCARSSSTRFRNGSATVRLRGPRGSVVDLIAATCGVEPEVVEHATVVSIPGVGELPVARAEDLLAMKVLAITPGREEDAIDARNLLLMNPDLDRAYVRERLAPIKTRGFHRDQDLDQKLESILSGLAD